MKYFTLQNEHFTGIDDLMKYIFESRGVQDISGYINPTEEAYHDGFLLERMADGLSMLNKHLSNPNGRIHVQVDPDCDGFCSSSMIISYINEISPQTNVTYSLHTDKKHGILVDEVPEDCTLVIIPDAASNEFYNQFQLMSSGKDVLILDHHEIEDTNQNFIIDKDKVIIINNQISQDYPNKQLCGTGVVYKFINCYDEIYEKECAKKYIDLVAVATVADMMLINELENRYFIVEGLKNINNPFLSEIVKSEEFSITKYGGFSPQTIGFTIAPLINAIIRIGTQDEKELVFRSLIWGNDYLKSTKRGAEEEETETLACQALRCCKNAKSRQQRIRDKIFAQLCDSIEKNGLQFNSVIVVETNETEEFDSNLTGLIANKIADKYNKPSFVLTKNEDNVLKGSARSIKSIADLKGMCTDSGLFDLAQGHAGAFGAHIPANNVDKLLAYMEKEISKSSESAYIVDFKFSATVDNDLIEFINVIGSIGNIWGRGFEEPTFYICDIYTDTNNIQFIGKNENTAKITYNDVSYMIFNPSLVEKLKADIFDISNESQDECVALVMDIVGKANVNEWNGRITPQIIIEDYEISEGQWIF